MTNPLKLSFTSEVKLASTALDFSSTARTFTSEVLSKAPTIAKTASAAFSGSTTSLFNHAISSIPTRAIVPPVNTAPVMSAVLNGLKGLATDIAKNTPKGAGLALLLHSPEVGRGSDYVPRDLPDANFNFDDSATLESLMHSPGQPRQLGGRQIIEGLNTPFIAPPSTPTRHLMPPPRDGTREGLIVSPRQEPSHEPMAGGAIVDPSKFKLTGRQKEVKNTIEDTVLYTHFPANGKGSVLIPGGARASYGQPLVQEGSKVLPPNYDFILTTRGPVSDISDAQKIPGVRYVQADTSDITPEFLADHNVRIVLPMANTIGLSPKQVDELKAKGATPQEIDRLNFEEAFKTNVADRFQLALNTRQVAETQKLPTVIADFSSHSVYTTGFNNSETSITKGSATSNVSPKSPYAVTTYGSEMMGYLRSEHLDVPIFRVPTTVGDAPFLRPDGMIQPHEWIKQFFDTATVDASGNLKGKIVIYDHKASTRPYADNYKTAEQVWRVITHPERSLTNDLYILGRPTEGGGAVRTEEVAQMIVDIAKKHGQEVEIEWSNAHPPVGGYRNFSVDTSHFFNTFGGTDLNISTSLERLFTRMLAEKKASK